MKIALITTTINIPQVLSLYAVDTAIDIIVAADKKTPPEAEDYVNKNCGPITRIDYLTVEAQQDLGYKCSELIGWNTIQRRNIALLQALRYGAELVVTIDDDNIPINEGYYANFEFRMLTAFSGIELSNPAGWYDPGKLLRPHVKHRGFPFTEKAADVAASVTEARVGLAEGLILGDTDMCAVDRISQSPDVYGVTEIGRAGVVTDPRKTWTVVNTQNTAFLRELAPAMFCMPGLGRMDDIFASLICQRVMAERGLYVHFGKPFVFQQRNPHNLYADLRAEIDGMEKMVAFANCLRQIRVPKGDVIGQCETIVKTLYGHKLLPEQSVECALAFYKDVETVL